MDCTASVLEWIYSEDALTKRYEEICQDPRISKEQKIHYLKTAVIDTIENLVEWEKLVSPR